MRSGNWKLIEFYELNKTELYDLENDPGETNNLAEENPQKVIELQQSLSSFQKTTAARFPYPNPDYPEY